MKISRRDILIGVLYLVKTMAELGYKPKAIVAQDAGFSESSFYEAVGDMVEGVRRARARPSMMPPRKNSWGS